jgi:hypothetical protein
MNFFPLIIGAVAVVIIVIVIFVGKGKFRFGNKKNTAFKSVNFRSFKRKKQILRVDKDTLLEKSWEFFTKIAQVVFHKFSRADQEAVLQIGIELEKAGMKYCHVINFHEIRQQLSPEVTRVKDKEIQQGR